MAWIPKEGHFLSPYLISMSGFTSSAKACRLGYTLHSADLQRAMILKHPIDLTVAFPGTIEKDYMKSRNDCKMDSEFQNAKNDHHGLSGWEIRYRELGSGCKSYVASSHQPWLPLKVSTSHHTVHFTLGDLVRETLWRVLLRAVTWA